MGGMLLLNHQDHPAKEVHYGQVMEQLCLLKNVIRKILKLLNWCLQMCVCWRVLDLSITDLIWLSFAWLSQMNNSLKAMHRQLIKSLSTELSMRPKDTSLPCLDLNDELDIREIKKKGLSVHKGRWFRCKTTHGQHHCCEKTVKKTKNWQPYWVCNPSICTPFCSISF